MKQAPQGTLKLMGWFERLFRQHAYSISLDEADSTFLYRERGRCMHIRGEMMPEGYAVYSSSIVKWDTETGQATGDFLLVDETERLRISANIGSYFGERCKAVYFY